MIFTKQIQMRSKFISSLCCRQKLFLVWCLAWSQLILLPAAHPHFLGDGGGRWMPFLGCIPPPSLHAAAFYIHIKNGLCSVSAAFGLWNLRGHFPELWNNLLVHVSQTCTRSFFFSQRASKPNLLSTHFKAAFTLVSY